MMFVIKAGLFVQYFFFRYLASRIVVLSLHKNTNKRGEWLKIFLCVKLKFCTSVYLEAGTEFVFILFHRDVVTSILEKGHSRVPVYIIMGLILVTSLS